MEKDLLFLDNCCKLIMAMVIVGIRFLISSPVIRAFLIPRVKNGEAEDASLRKFVPPSL